MEYFNGSDEKPLALFGDSGSGKTCVMAHAACMLKEKFNLQNVCIVMRFIGTSHHSSCIRLLLRSVCQQVNLIQQLNLNFKSAHKLFKQAFSIFKPSKRSQAKMIAKSLSIYANHNATYI